MAQTQTYHQLTSLPSKSALVDQFVGKPLNGLRTPAFVIDRGVFASNCANMHQKAKDWGASFRAHLKTHKVSINQQFILHLIQVQ